MWHITLLLLLMLICCEVDAFGENRTEIPSSDSPQPALTEAINDLKSTDVQRRNIAEKALCDLDPSMIETLRKLASTNAFLARFVEMHDKLRLQPGNSVRASTVNRAAQEALAFFATNEAVKILTIGLQSPSADVRYQTAEALTSVPEGRLRQDRKFIASAIASYLCNHLSDIPQGGEDVVIQQETNKVLSRFLVTLLDLTLDKQTAPEKCLQATDEWLKAN